MTDVHVSDEELCCSVCGMPRTECLAKPTEAQLVDGDAIALALAEPSDRECDEAIVLTKAPHMRYECIRAAFANRRARLSERKTPEEAIIDVLMHKVTGEKGRARELAREIIAKLHETERTK